MQCKISEKRKLALIIIVSTALTYSFLANNSSKQILADDSESFNVEHENYFELLNTANPTNLDFIESIFDSKSANFSSKGYYPQVYSDSLQATYYALYVLNSIGKISEINQSEVTNYLMSFYNSSSHHFVDSSAKRYLSSSIPGLYIPLTTLLEINCYAVLSLDILNALNSIDTAETVDFIWKCYHPNLHGFIGQPYDVSLDEGFKTPTADNTYYAVITLDLLISDWGAYSQERNDIINFVDGLQSLGSNTGFFNDKDFLFDSLLEIEPNQFASFYAIKTLETFGSAYINVINVAKFHQDLTDLYHLEGSYFDISSVGWVENYTNIVATAINLELSDLTGFTSFDRAGVINFITNNRNALGGWDASTTIKHHELIDTFQIVRSLANTGEISGLTQSDKNEIASFIGLFSQLNGYSLLPEDYSSVELIYTVISSFEYFDRIADLDIQALYNLLEKSAKYMGGDYDFYACTKLDSNVASFRSKPLDYYTLGFHKHVEEINSMYSHKETYSILDSLKKIFKLNDFAASCDLNSVLQGVIDSQFMDQNYQKSYGAFLHDNIFSSSEWKNKMIYLKYSFYAIKVMEFIADDLGLGPITNLAFNKTALANYIVGKSVETPSELYFDLKYSNKVEDRLENLYYAIYSLKAIDQFDLNSVKIENYAVNNLNYSNFKNLYYCYKISQILDLEIAFDVEQTHSLVQSIYSSAYCEFFESTERNRIEQEAFGWVCEIAKTDPVSVSVQYSDSVQLGGNNLISVELCNLILTDFGQYATVRLESTQLGTILFEQMANYTYQKEIGVSTDPENYPEITGNITAYDGATIVGQVPISFSTTFNSTHELLVAKTSSSITILVNASLILAKGAQPFYGDVWVRIYREGAYIGNVNFSSEDFATYTRFNFTYNPDIYGNYFFETYMENGYDQNPQLLDYEAFSYQGSPPESFIISSDAGIPDKDGKFTLNWTISNGANNYSVYVYSSYITEINGSLILMLEEADTLSLPISIVANGTYYIVAVAYNDFGNTMSNCINVTVAITEPPPPPDPPGDFVISSSANNPDKDGKFTLNWTISNGANNYSVYVYSSYITEINGSLILLLEEADTLSLPISIVANGTYYFVAVAYNDVGNRISNCISVTVAITDFSLPPGDFVTSSSASDPDKDGTFTLDWTSSDWTNNYSIYQYHSYIAEINGSLTLLLEEVETLSLSLGGYSNGIYYFVVVAFNDFGNTTSNCINIVVDLSQPPNPPDPSGLPGDFVISSSANNPDKDGNFTLEWTSSEGANNYSVYKYHNYITEINGSLTLLLEEVANLSLSLSDYSNGTYYFVAVAYNDFGSKFSNCIKVTIDFKPPCNNDPTNDDVNPNYPIELSTVVLLAIGSVGLPTGTIVALKKVRFSKKAKKSVLNN